MKNTAEDQAVSDRAYGTAQDHLRQFVERIEAQRASIKGEMAVLKEIYAEAKSTGFDVTALRQIITIRAKDADAYAEQQAQLDLYKNALGMA
ncbi:DUF2312 domain-containing protein [uncultured Paracoccus sp.]|uniref:DUF2312 domain-containing protein n=1 Tax=uncultured Paracoccus sp. TaxID=189685 RepID=UPI0025EDA1F4|nr:DUF2312 domain-containing protein [uncultured Paracoccus sp.]